MLDGELELGEVSSRAAQESARIVRCVAAGTSD